MEASAQKVTCKARGSGRVVHSTACSRMSTIGRCEVEGMSYLSSPGTLSWSTRAEASCRCPTSWTTAAIVLARELLAGLVSGRGRDQLRARHRTQANTRSKRDKIQ